MNINTLPNVGGYHCETKEFKMTNFFKDHNKQITHNIPDSTLYNKPN